MSTSSAGDEGDAGDGERDLRGGDLDGVDFRGDGDGDLLLRAGGLLRGVLRVDTGIVRANRVLARSDILAAGQAGRSTIVRPTCKQTSISAAVVLRRFQLLNAPVFPKCELRECND
eukprot:COSAG01_NODE_25778_length_733_cov_1.242902_1_plen_115_part_10